MNRNEVSGLTFVDLDLDETQLGGSIVWTEPEDTTQVRGRGCGLWLGGVG